MTQLNLFPNFGVPEQERLYVIGNGFDSIPVVWLEPQIVNKENIDDIIIKSGFHTSGEVYR